MTEKAAVILDIRIEDTDHFVMRCACSEGKGEIEELDEYSRIQGWHELGENEKV